MPSMRLQMPLLKRANTMAMKCIGLHAVQRMLRMYGTTRDTIFTFQRSKMKPVKNKDIVWKQDTLKREILSWWRQFRPVGWTILAHIENPTVNTASQWDKRLCKIAAKLARSNFNRDGTRK